MNVKAQFHRFDVNDINEKENKKVNDITDPLKWILKNIFNEPIASRKEIEIMIDVAQIIFTLAWTILDIDLLVPKAMRDHINIAIIIIIKKFANTNIRKVWNTLREEK